MKLLTYRSYKHVELYTEIYGSIAVNTCQIELARNDKIMLADDIMILYSKSTLYTSSLYKSIQFTLSMILMQKLKQQFYDQDKI